MKGREVFNAATGYTDGFVFSDVVTGETGLMIIEPGTVTELPAGFSYTLLDTSEWCEYCRSKVEGSRCQSCGAPVTRRPRPL